VLARGCALVPPKFMHPYNSLGCEDGCLVAKTYTKRVSWSSWALSIRSTGPENVYTVVRIKIKTSTSSSIASRVDSLASVDHKQGPSVLSSLPGWAWQPSRHHARIACSTLDQKPCSSALRNTPYLKHASRLFRPIYWYGVADQAVNSRSVAKAML
jgi:hypothetical protein